MESTVDLALRQLIEQFGSTAALRSCIEGRLNTLFSPKMETPKKVVRVYMDGCFDIMHSGHYNAIRQAKQLGDILVAGVHTDKEILRNKGY
jgi:bifunctional ADP-heptose synthase (sugar kinase/adenylyltransferase)